MSSLVKPRCSKREKPGESKISFEIPKFLVKKFSPKLNLLNAKLISNARGRDASTFSRFRL